MITKRNGNGQTECFGCKEKGIFSLNWDSSLYNFNDEPYCFDCLIEKLEELNEENQQLKNNWNELKKYTDKTKFEEFEKSYGKRYGKTFTQAEIIVCNMIKGKIEELEEKVR